MIVTLIETYRIFNMTLPDKVKGRFWITDVDSFGNDRKLISVEADEGSWVLKGSDSAVICDTHNRIADDTVLEDNVFYNVRILEENEEGYVYAQPDDIGRQTFDKYVFRDNAELTIGRDSDNTVCINNRYVSSHHAVIKYMDGVWTIEDKNSTNGTFVNNRRTSLQELRPGDVLFIVGFKLIIGSNYIAFNNPGNTVKWDNNILQNMKPQEFDGVGKTKTTEIRPQFFYRAPRFKRDISTLKFKVDMPPAKEAQNNMPMAMIMGPSITMGMASMSSGAFSVINAINSGGNVMSVIPTAAMSVSMLLGMVMWPIITKKHEKKESQRCEAERQKLYKEYLFSLRDTIRREIENQEQILRENNISIDEASDRIINRLGNLWERNINQDDFLSISLGNGNIQMCEEIQFPDGKFSVNKDNLINDMFALANEPRELKSVPVVHSFKNNKVTGIVGENDRKVKDFVMSLIIKIAALHSYDELKLVFILSEKDDDIVNVVKWFPHTWDDEHVKRYIDTNLREAKEISSELEQEFYNRRELRNEDIAAPYYLIISTNKEIAEKTEIYDKVIENSKCNGYSIINVCGKFRMLPKETVSVIEIDDEGSKIYEKNDISGNSIMFEAESGIKCNINDIAVRLANTQLDIASRMYELPDMITFLDMYGVDRIEHLNPLIRWKENNPTVSLSAPVGVDTTGELFTLDLHEKYQGPHGLVAGMTGSGKSEFIITYILSMAVNYHPDEVAFILIDYKGGGLTGAFEDKEKGIKLPHLAGTITNLDGAAVKRSLISIQSELRRRQAVFNEARKVSNEGTMDIYKYQKLYRDKVVTEPVPHLFIISDEFAELKTQQPEFMEQLISAARIGRSLGVHLILATQKPSGVVDDQIWSNTRFRVCLKVQDKSDSNDMIKRSDAAELSHTGRFYLQVGFNEYFAKGQSAWCGATYYEDGNNEQMRPVSVSVIDNTGRTVKQVKEIRHNNNPSKKTKQIVALVKYLSDIATEEGIHERTLWMDEIPAIVYVDELIKKYGIRNDLPHILKPVVGEVDDPFNQNQFPLVLPISDGGNTIIYGTAGSGKLTLLNTVIYELIRNHITDYLNIYIMDFGSETLKVFEKAPQVGGVVLLSEKEKVINLIKMLRKEIITRKKAFADYGGDYRSYINNSGKTYPNIVVIINNFSALIETYEECEDSIGYITREGIKYGIFFIVTANNSGAVRFRLAQNFSNIYVMQMNDRDDYTGILGPVEGTYPSKYKGRGIFKTEHTYEFQTAVFSKAEKINECINGLIEKLREDGIQKAKTIPVLPVKVDCEYLSDHGVTLDKFIVGIDTKTLEPAILNIRDSYITVGIANDIQSLITYGQGMAEIISDKKLAEVIVIDGTGSFYPDETKKYAYFAEGYEEKVVALFNEVLRRHKILKNNENMGDEGQLVYILFGFSKIFDFLSADGKDKLKVALEKGKHELKVNFVLIDEGTSLAKQSMDNWYKVQCGNLSGVWVGDGSSEQYILKITKVRSELYQEMADGLGVYINKGRYNIIKHISSKADIKEETEV